MIRTKEGIPDRNCRKKSNIINRMAFMHIHDEEGPPDLEEGEIMDEEEEYVSRTDPHNHDQGIKGLEKTRVVYQLKKSQREDEYQDDR